METRPYFLAGDLSCSVVTGTLAALAASGTVGAAWPMPVAMLTGMLLGMAVAAVGVLVFGPLFGMIEIQMPAMLAGMAGGMVVGMVAASRPVSWSLASALGAGFGLLAFAAVWAADARLRARGARWTS